MKEARLTIREEKDKVTVILHNAIDGEDAVSEYKNTEERRRAWVKFIVPSLISGAFDWNNPNKEDDLNTFLDFIKG